MGFRKRSRSEIIASGIIFIITLTSVLLNIFLYREMMKYYKLLYASELDPLGLSYYQTQPVEHSSDLPMVVFFGDSRASQWVTPTLEGFAFVNRGIGNQTSAQVASRFEFHASPLKPEIIIIQVGINDLKTIPLFPERKGEIISNCERNIDKIVYDSLANNATVILTTIIPASGNVPLARKLVWSDEIYKAIAEVNSHIAGLASDKVIVLDAASLVSDSDGKTKPEYSADLLHLNRAGYKAINLELVKILQTLD